MSIKLFCIPHAGGSGNIYLPWKQKLDTEIELLPVELAGRGRRYGEHFYQNWKEAAQDIYAQIISELKPEDSYAIYGHSMGSWLAFEVLDIICRKHLPQPEYMFFSGNTPPFLEPEEEKIGHLPDTEFIERILAMGDTPKEVFDSGVVDYFLPPLKQDYQLVESYHHEYHDVDYSGNIVVFYGKFDVMTREEALQWEKYSHRGFYIQEFESGHMFIKDQVDTVADSINRIIREEAE